MVGGKERSAAPHTGGWLDAASTFQLHAASASTVPLASRLSIVGIFCAQQINPMSATGVRAILCPSRVSFRRRQSG